jgi:sulfur carrier protein ThiS
VTITVHMHGNLRRFMPGGRDRMAMEVGTGTTIEALLLSLGAGQDTWLVAVNGATVSRDHVLVSGDQLECFEPVAAG